MKKLLFVLVMLFALSACAAKIEPPVSLPQPVEPAPSVSAEQPLIVPKAPEEAAMSSVSWSEFCIDGACDEICAYGLILPVFQTENDEAAANINAFYDALGTELVDYAGGKVYETAQSRNCIAEVSGSFDAKAENGVLAVDYTVTVSYSDEAEPQANQRTDVFDLTTGERLEH